MNQSEIDEELMVLVEEGAVEQCVAEDGELVYRIAKRRT
jgi:hypothetical protein